MGDVIPLHGPDDRPENDPDLVADLARYDEELLSQQSIKGTSNNVGSRRDGN